MSNLQNYKYDIRSQWGEDGIIEEILNRIGVENKVCIEFGAWDGEYLSNTWNLWKNKGWNAFLIEGDKKRYHDLNISSGSCNNVLAFNYYVAISGVNSLDNILLREKVDAKIDLLSIDVDGDDYHIFESLKVCRPRIVIVEYNPTIPPDIDLVQKPGEYFGASALAMCRLAKEKSYKLAAITDTNCIFVTVEEFDKLKIEEPILRDIFIPNHLTNVICSFDGTPLINRVPPYFSFISNFSKNKIPKYVGNCNLLPILILENQSFIKTFYKVYTGRIQTFIAKSRFYILYKARLDKRNNLKAHLKKQAIINEFVRKCDINVFIETGTYYGQMVEAMKSKFKRIISIELDKDLFYNAQDKFKNDEHIKIFQGDSSKKLPKILKNISEPCLFWLDGHYSGGITAKGRFETPIMKELDAIFNHDIKNHIILIDDARLFVGKNDYPGIRDLENYVQENNSNWNFVVENDVIRIFM